MRHRTVPLALVVLALVAVAVPAVALTRPELPGEQGHHDDRTMRAGVGVVDATWNVGASAGQYADPHASLADSLSGSVDPHTFSTLKEPSYGIQARLTARAIVVEGTDGTRIALLKTDNYLAQDLLLRRVGQLLDADGTSKVTYDHILYGVTHDHSSPYYTTTSPGVWAFQDAFDQRMFEYQARAMAGAVEKAAADLQPARMSATTVPFTIMKDNIVGPALADDGTPAGYPRSFGDTGLVVMRFDTVGHGRHDKGSAPIAVWSNFGEHPESLDGYGLTTADYVAPLERFVERDLGVPLVVSQGDVGSSEGPYDRGTMERLPDGTYRAYAHAGYAQAERGARYYADAVEQGWAQADTDAAQVPWSSDAPVKALTRWTPGPVSHPYPSVSNCRTEPTYEGNPGVPAAGLPDCARPDSGTQANPVVDALRLHGVPVPDHYDAPGYPSVEENTRLKLQVFRIGEVLLASCACEAQVDIVKNIESRADDVTGDIWDGYDWGATCTPVGATYTCPDPRNAAKTLTLSTAAYRHMQAEVHNDAKGWDDPAYAVTANAEPTDPALIKGNFTKEELPASRGYALPVAVGHAGDYNGYTVSYREYMSRDSYRKALTTYGPHTADYMATRLVKMAGFLKGGPALPPEPNDGQAQADEARQAALAAVIGAESGRAYDAFRASLPDDKGPVAVLTQPKDLTRFGAAFFTWRGGSNAVDNPQARVERRVDGQWQPFADMTGEVQTMVRFPQGVQGVADTYTGTQEWVWTAGFEAFDGFPARLGSTPTGDYRFVVDGVARAGSVDRPYRLGSAVFHVGPWSGITARDGRVEADGSVSFSVDPVRYPRTYASPFRTIADDHRTTFCKVCSFRPWATSGEVASAVVTVTRADGTVVDVPAAYDGSRWVAASALRPGDTAVVRSGAVLDAFGETNGTALRIA
jgi:hypothetical protein